MPMRWTGLAAVGLLWSTNIFLVGALDFDLLGKRPLSDLALGAGVGPLFGVGLAGSAVLFVAFLADVRRRYPAGRIFSIVMLAGMICQFVAGVVPIGDERAVHVTAALALGASIPIFMWRFAADQPPGTWRRRCYALFWLEVAACIVGVTLSRLQIAAVAEILPALAFHAWVAVLTFGRR